MTDEVEKDPGSLGVGLSSSIGSESFELIANTSDLVLDKIISSGALDGVPIVGLLTGGFKAVREVRSQIFLNKVVRFLKELNLSTDAERIAFVERLQRQDRMESFGANILLILERTDDLSKPKIMGKILAAHISGKIDQLSEAMRLVAIVNRVYAPDLLFLLSFQPGLQEHDDVAASLQAAGLLRHTGIDGGDAMDGSGGYMYDLNKYGQLLITHGLN